MQLQLQRILKRAYTKIYFQSLFSALFQKILYFLQLLKKGISLAPEKLIFGDYFLLSEKVLYFTDTSYKLLFQKDLALQEYFLIAEFQLLQ